MRKPEITKWIEGLRSGKYKQAVGTICKNHESYCCLGVLGIINNVFDNTDTHDVVVYVGYPYARDIIGIENQYKFQDFNDRDGLTFAEIADKVEEIFPNE